MIRASARFRASGGSPGSRMETKIVADQRGPFVRLITEAAVRMLKWFIHIHKPALFVFDVRMKVEDREKDR